MSNLPSWTGASVCYSRIAIILRKQAEAGYAAGRAKDKRKSYRYSPSPEMRAAVDAMNRGIEEAIKAYIASHMSLLTKEELASSREELPEETAA